MLSTSLNVTSAVFSRSRCRQSASYVCGQGRRAIALPQGFVYLVSERKRTMVDACLGQEAVMFTPARTISSGNELP